MLYEVITHPVTDHRLSKAVQDRRGSRLDSRLFELIAGKSPLKFRFPEAAIRH